MPNKFLYILVLAPALLGVIGLVINVLGSDDSDSALFTVWGFLALSFLFIGLLEKGEMKAVEALIIIFFAVVVGVILAFWALAALIKTGRYENVLTLIFGILFITMLPFWSHLGSFKVIPVYNSHDKLYDYRIMNSEEFGEINKNHGTLSILALLFGIAICVLGFFILRLVSLPFAVIALVLFIIWNGYLIYTRGGILNLGASFVHMVSPESINEFDRKPPNTQIKNNFTK